MAHLFPGHRLDGLCVTLQLLIGIRHDDQRQDAEHHPLVAGGQVVQKLLALFPLQLHVVGDDGGEVVVLVLPALPVGDVSLHPQQPVLHLPHRLICGDGQDVNGEHQVPVQVRQLVHHLILNVVGVLLQVQHPAVFVPQLQVVTEPLHAVGTDGILETVA